MSNKYKAMMSRLGEFELEPDQLLAKLQHVYHAALHNREERINPKLTEPVMVLAPNLGVARQCVKDMIDLANDIRVKAGVDDDNSDVKYEMLPTWVSSEGEEI